MAGLSAGAKDQIAAVLDSKDFAQNGFTIRYDDEKNPVATITVSSTPEYQFIINSANEGEFTTSECPGIHLDTAETFQRSNFGLCIDGIEEWAKRIVDKEKDWMMDEFGGVADRNPSLPTKG